LRNNCHRKGIDKTSSLVDPKEARGRRKKARREIQGEAKKEGRYPLPFGQELERKVNALRF